MRSAWSGFGNARGRWRMSLGQAIADIQDDELVEVTPKVVRIRKRFLDPHERKRASRRAEGA
jgi:GTP-binding protein